MSIDFDAVCFKCRKHQHIGQDMACKKSFGYGSNDLDGANVAAGFVIEHALWCGSVTVIRSDDIPEGFMWIPTEPGDEDEDGFGRGGVEEQP